MKSKNTTQSSTKKQSIFRHPEAGVIMKCPHCGTQGEEIKHGHIEHCVGCGLTMEVYGNSKVDWKYSFYNRYEHQALKRQSLFAFHEDLSHMIRHNNAPLTYLAFFKLKNNKYIYLKYIPNGKHF